MAFLKRKKKPEEEKKAQDEVKQVVPPQQEEESVEDILKEIKSIVSGGEAEDDAMDLTEMVELDDVVEEEVKPLEQEILEKEIVEQASAVAEEKNEEDKFVDVLAEIDSELADSAPLESQGEQAAQEDEPLSLDQLTAEESEAPAILTEEPIIQQAEEIIAERSQIVEENLEEVKPAASFAEQISENLGAVMAEETKESLISKDKAEKSAQVIKNLLDNIPRPKIDSPEFRSGSTVEDIVVESLKPMLKQWLDKNLEKIVHEIVEKEIRKIIPREE